MEKKKKQSKPKWVSTPDEEQKYGWKIRYELKTETRIYTVSVGVEKGKKKLSTNLSDLTNNGYFYLYAENGVGNSTVTHPSGLVYWGAVSYLFNELQQNLKGLPPAVAKEIRDVRIKFSDNPMGDLVFGGK